MREFSKEISVVIGSYNRKRYLVKTLQTLRDEVALAGYPVEIIVIDGGSTDGTLAWLAQQKDIVTVVQHNRGNWQGRPIARRSWGYFMNLGFKIAQGKYVCMLSDDCLVIPGAIRNGYALAEEQRNAGRNIGAVAFYWRNWPEQQEYWLFHFYGVLNVNHGLYLRQALVDVDYADEDLYRFYYGDIDLSFKLVQRGYEIIPSETSFVEHYMHTDAKFRAENLALDAHDGECFVRKWREVYGSERFVADNRVRAVSKAFADPADTASRFAQQGCFARLWQPFRRKHG